MSVLKISVVTPSYNQGHFLEDTIRSVLSQNYPKLEYIIIDGGSTDNSLNVIKKYENKLSYWVSEPDEGQSDALNKGFKLATGELIGWLNSDDVYVRNSLHVIARAFEMHSDKDLIYGNYYNIDDSGNILKTCYDLPYHPWIWKLGGLFFCQPASFFKRSVFDRIGYLDRANHYSMDTNFFYRMMLNGCNFKHISDFLAKFRYHSTSKTVARQKQMKLQTFREWEKYYGTTNLFLNMMIYSFFHLSFRGMRFLNRNMQLCLKH